MKATRWNIVRAALAAAALGALGGAGCGDIKVPPDNTMPASCEADGDCDDGLTCTINTCESGQCARTIVSGRCLIGGVCLSDGAGNPKDDCLACAAARPTEWTNVCGPDVLGDTGQGDAVTDAGAGDAGPGDVGPGDAQAGDVGPGDVGPAVPPAPVLSQPQENLPVAGVVPVAGQGLPSGSVSVELLDGGALLVGSILPTDAAGLFSGELTYDPDAPGLAPGSLLTLRATQSNAAGVSPPATVTVIHQELVTVPGALDLADAPPAPAGGSDKVYVRAFLHPGDAVGWVAETVVDLADDATGMGSWALSLPTGTYWVRAFRDDGGPDWAAPDGQPTLGLDPQSPAAKVLAEKIPGAPPGPYMLALTVPASAPHYGRFDVYTVHESGAPREPQRWDPQSGTWVEGDGACGGYYLRMQTDGATAGTAGLSPPEVRLPSGQVLALLDDGGCGQDVADNTAGSYDVQPGDGAFSRGLPEPDATAAGTYLLSYRDTTTDQLHVEADTLTAVKKLSRRMILTSPTAAEAADSVTPTLTWTPVDGAAGYRVNMETTHGASWNNYGQGGNETTGPSYTPWQALPDDVAVEVHLEAFDVALTDPHANIGATSIAVRNAFVVDTDGVNTVHVTGTIQNELSVSAPLALRLEDHDGWYSSAWLDPGATSFVLTALRATVPDAGELWAFADVDGSGQEDTAVNDAYSFWVEDLDLSGGEVTAELVLRDPVQTIEPAPDTVGVGLKPTFSWIPYPNPPAGAWTWLLYARPAGGQEDVPALAWGLPPEVTSFDLAASPPPEAVDLLPSLTCSLGGGSYDEVGGTCVGATAIPSAGSLDGGGGGGWYWGVALTTCGFGADYVECLLGQVPDGFYAYSGESWFMP